MDYRKTLDKLRQEIFAAPVMSNQTKQAAFIPQRQKQQPAQQEPLTAAKSWLKQIRESSIEAKKRFEAGKGRPDADMITSAMSLVQPKKEKSKPIVSTDEQLAETASGNRSEKTNWEGSVSASPVSTLVDRIIQVESGGNATARNPRSTATGAGQFIESTWLKMMNTYRPELASSMDRSALLRLRNDPDLSREMVSNLAKENANYLDSKGHAVTAGTLYLAHFLGPGGANRALSASPSASVKDIMGNGVVTANPFLANYTIGDLVNWANNKMRT